MALYYVRKTGDDADDGSTPALAFLTVDHAANTVAAGDIVWIGGGVYRETVTIDTSGTLGSEIEWRADIDGAITGDAGLVVITALADEVGAGGTGSPLNLNGKDYNEFYNIIFGPGGTGSADVAMLAKTGNAVYQGMLFDTCVFIPAVDPSNKLIDINFLNGGAIAGTPMTFKNCWFGGSVVVTFSTFSADAACGPHWENCTFQSWGSGASIKIDGPSSGSFGPTAYKIFNNTFLQSATFCVYVLDQWGTGAIGTMHNNLFITTYTEAVEFVSDSGSWSGDNNLGTCEVLVSDSGGNYTDGANDADKIGVLLGAWVEPILRNVYGSTPYLPYEQVWDHNGAGYKSGGIDVGGAAYAPAADIYGNPRPMGRTNDDAGAVETRRRPEKETTTFQTGPTSAKFSGAGYHDFTLPVTAASTTVTVYGRYDANYTGDKPILEALNIDGVADQSDAMTGASGAWEQLTVTFTPDSVGTVRIRIRSRDTSATGICYFDTMAVS